jgi:hypothetical protein
MLIFHAVQKEMTFNIEYTYMHNHSPGSAQSTRASGHPIHRPHNGDDLTQS